MRNPHGATEWNSTWSDRDKKHWTPSMQRKLDHDPNDPDDGDFFMPFESMCKEFVNVQFCMYEENHDYQAFLEKSSAGTPIYFHVKAETAGYYYFTVNQKNKRHFPK